MNHAELFLSILVRKLLRRGSFTSIEDLVAKVRGFIAYDNRTMATPVKWTYQGKTLVAYSAELSLPRCTRRTP